MSNENVITEYVPKELFDIHIQNIRDKNASDEKLTDARFDALEKLLDERFSNIQNVMGKNLAEFKTIAAKTDGRIDTIEAKLEHALDTLSIAINSNNQRLDDFRNELEHKQSASAAKIGIYTALFIGTVQVVVSVVLHFWF